MKIFQSLVLTICCSITLQITAQNEIYTVRGHVYFTQLQIPLPDAEVLLVSSQGVALASDITDASGHYSLKTNLTETGSDSALLVQVLDPCTGSRVQVTPPFDQNPADVDLVVCTIDQPPCNADFTYINRSDLELQFFSLSIFQPIESWFWEFGDSTTSDQANPHHRYENAGLYLVTLRITTSDGCSAELTKEVLVEPQSCNCPEYAFPVCVQTAAGEILTFDNPCFAECAGYSVVMSCDSDCDCPTNVDPVCVSAFDTQIMYINACNATCDGFDSFMECDSSCICPDIYDPVCVLTSTGQIRFSNACEAECAGYIDYTACDSCFCPLYFVSEPVCAFGSDGQLLYFDNPCLAECAGYPDYYLCDSTSGCPLDLDPVCIDIIEGTLRFLNSCHSTFLGYPDVFTCDSCECAPIYDPVCAPTPNGDTIRFQSPCHATCAGYDSFFVCDTSCICAEEYDPVCVSLPDGTIKEFSNSCFAECAGYFDYFICEDTCMCSREFDPVCVITAGGQIIQYANECLARCAGHNAFVSCEPDCFCDGIFDPVCVITDDGTVIRYQSACEAICNGYHVFYDCDILCICPAVYDPVCVNNDNGTIMKFDNSCMAECMGYSAYEKCDGITPDVFAPGDHPSKRSQDLSVSPNPFDQYIEVSAEVPVDGKYNLRIIDPQGLVVRTEGVQAFGHHLHVTTYAADIPTGIYLLVLENEFFHAISRVIKTK